MTLKLTIKKSIASICQASGVFCRLSRHSPGIVLMYHRVLALSCNDHFVQPGMYVYTNTFERHLIELHNKFTIISLPDLINRVESGMNTLGCCVLTFDDGWLDNYTEAFPLLLKYNVPATIFLTTGYIGTARLFWPEEVVYCLSQLDDLYTTKIVLLRRLVTEMTIKKKSDIFYDTALEILKKWTPEMREKLLTDLRKNSNTMTSGRQMMNWDEVKEMNESGLITFGAHTANHVILDQVPLPEAEREIVQSRDQIKKILKIAPKFFAYPNGNYSPEIKELVKKHGFKAAVTTIRGKCVHDVDIFKMPRIGMHDDVSNTEAMFLARMNLKWF